LTGISAACASVPEAAKATTSAVASAVELKRERMDIVSPESMREDI
jgi:hypothetical protein